MSLFVFICFYLSLFVFICLLFVFICLYLSLFVFICLYLSLFVFICFYLFLFVFICLYLSLFVFICLYLSLFVFICLYLSLICLYLSLFVKICRSCRTSPVDLIPVVLVRCKRSMIGLAVTEQMQGLAFCEAVLAGAGKRSPFWEDDGTHARNTQAWVFLREEPGNARIRPKESGVSTLPVNPNPGVPSPSTAPP